MSHHLDSPQSRQDVRLNITDLYVFRGEVGTVLVMDTNSTISGPDAPQGFHPEARYEFRIDLSGDAVEDLAFRLTFGLRDQDGRQSVELRRLDGADTRDASALGMVLASGSTDSVISGPSGLRIWAGLAAEPFAIDPTVLAAVATAFQNGVNVDLTGWSVAAARNLFAGTNVNAIVLELPDSVFAAFSGEQARIGVWATTTLATDAGGWRQINRAGLPMMQPIFSPSDSVRGSAYNSAQPSADRATYGSEVAEKVAAVIAAHETSDDPAAYGAVVANLLLPDVLTYAVGTTASFSFATRNGRALTDDAPTVMYSLVTNSALTTGMTRHSASTPRQQFPYLALSVTAGELVRS